MLSLARKLKLFIESNHIIKFLIIVACATLISVVASNSDSLSLKSSISRCKLLM